MPYLSSSSCLSRHRDPVLAKLSASLVVVHHPILLLRNGAGRFHGLQQYNGSFWLLQVLNLTIHGLLLVDVPKELTTLDKLLRCLGQLAVIQYPILLSPAVLLSAVLWPVVLLVVVSLPGASIGLMLAASETVSGTAAVETAHFVSGLVTE